MAVDLFNRLAPQYDIATRIRVMTAKWAGTPPHWVAPPSGRRIADVRGLVVHETTGFPARNSTAKAVGEFTTGRGEYTQFFIAGDGTVSEVIDALGGAQPLATGHATFVNNWSLGSETGHAWGNYSGNDHHGPFETIPHDPPQPDELRALPDHGGWRPLSGDFDNVEDLTGSGVKMWAKQFANPDEVVVACWTTGTYSGPWRSVQRVPEQLFTEWQYRSWALLARYLAERFLIPRNFAALPHKMRSGGFTARGGSGHGTESDGISFRTIVRADEILFRRPGDFGLTAAQLENADFVTQQYRNHVVHTPAIPNPHPPPANLAAFDSNPLWTVMFDHFRGIHGHGFSGDPPMPAQGHRGGGDHDCPGPMFDFHRMAREVWDWWWQPFDFNAGPPTDTDAPQTRTNAPRRPYSRNWDGNTPLSEYYYDNPPRTTYRGREVAGIHGPTGSPQTYRLEQGSPVYALATGDLVAARFPPETDSVSLAYTLIRHNVYHQRDPHQLAEPNEALPPGWVPDPERISYDWEPTSVYTLYMHLGRHVGMSFEEVTDANPDWLNRVLLRRKECELGLRFHDETHPTPFTDAAWSTRPPSGTPPTFQRGSLLEGWQADNAMLSLGAGLLAGGMTMVKPWLANAMPIKVLLGDYLGDSGIVNRTGPQYGVRIEVFSRDLISTDFNLTTSTAANRWRPAVGTPPPAVRYPSEWSMAVTGTERSTLEAAGVKVDDVPWLDGVGWTTRVNRLFPTDARLSDAEPVVHYHPQDFMAWINGRTWASEWPKYRIADPPSRPDRPRPRPR